MTSRKTPSISKNLTISLVILVGFLSLIFTGLSYYQISKNTEWQLGKTADKYIDSIAGTLQVPLWEMDRENISTICSYFIQNDWVVMLKLTSVAGEVMYQKTIPVQPGQGQFINRTRKILYRGETIGHLEIILNASDFYRKKLKFLKGTMAGILVCCTGLILFTGLLLKKFIKEPISVLGTIAESYSRGDYHPDMDVIPYREFKTVIEALFKMGETIDVQMNELKKAEASIREHRDRLEETVAKRTMELEEMNKNLHHEIQYRKQAQEALRTNEQRLEAILRSSPVGIGLVAEKCLNWANETLYHLVGYTEEEMMHQRASILFKSPEEFERYMNTLAKIGSKSSPQSIETQWIRKDGTVFDCIIRAYPHDVNDPSKGQIIAVADISDRKASEQALREKDRLQAVLELSGAICHELNQPLMGAMGHIDLLLMAISEDDPNIQRIEKIKIQLKRMSTISQKLMKISDYQAKDYSSGQILDLSVNNTSDADKD